MAQRGGVDSSDRKGIRLWARGMALVSRLGHICHFEGEATEIKTVECDSSLSMNAEWRHKDSNHSFTATLSDLFNHGRVSPFHSRIIQPLDIILPLLLVHTLDPTIVSHQPVDFALDVGGLRPYASAAVKPAHLILQFGQ